MQNISEFVSDGLLLSDAASLDLGKTLKPMSKSQEALILLLKSYLFVSDDFITRVASTIGVGDEELSAMLGKLNELRLKRQEELCKLKAQLYVQRYRCVAYQKQLEALPTGSGQRDVIRGRLEEAYSHYNNIRQQFADINQTASQEYIAESLDIQLPDIPFSLRLSEVR